MSAPGLGKLGDQRYDAWLIDLDGTLYNLRWVKLAMAAEVMLQGRGVLPVVRRFRLEHERLRQELTEPVDDPYALQLDRTAEALGMPRDEVAPIIEAWMIWRPAKWLRRFRREPLLQVIGIYRASGGRTALVSDYPAQRKLQAMQIDDLFDAVVANGEPGGPPRLKPHPDGLLLAAAQLDAAPARCLVLGDRDDADGAVARAAGMAFELVR